MSDLDEDVIELGSSDEESKAPAPKKKKLTPNAMVLIPDKYPGVTIKSSKPQKRLNPVSFVNSNIGKGVTVTKVISGKNVSNPFANKNKMNGKLTICKQIVKKLPALPFVNPSLTVTPKLKTGQITIKKVPLKVAQGISTASAVVQSLPKGCFPPGITVKRTSQLQTGKNSMKLNPASLQATRKTAFKKKEMVCVDLDDDEAAACPSGPQWYLRPEDQIAKSDELNKSGEQLAVPVESKKASQTEVEQTETSNLEQQNNKEPEPHYIEITIEDSPAKPRPKSKRTCEVSEMAITIDDSPVKNMADKTAPASGSDEETTAKEKLSKKKLNYPEKVVEIEIELTPVNEPSDQNKDESVTETVHMEVVEVEDSPLKCIESSHTSTSKKKIQPKPQIKLDVNQSLSLNPQEKTKDQKISPSTSGSDTETVHMEVLEVEDSPLKPIESSHTNTPKKRIQSKPQIKLDVNQSLSLNSQDKTKDQKTPPSTSGEFHPIYQSFIDLCFQLENSDDMNKIVDKKIKAYYKQVPKEYTESEMFTDMVASKIGAMKVGPEKMYLYIKDVVDELNMQRRIAKTQPAIKLDTVNQEHEKFLYGEDSEFDAKRQRQIRKLEKTLKKLHRAIQKLDEQEVDFEDEEDSVYLLTESDTSKDQVIEKNELLKRYKERIIRVHAKFCQLTNTKMPSEPRVQIDARFGQPKGPAKRLEIWINKKVPIGTPMPFPDFHDVLRCVRDANQEDKLGWNEADIMEEARDLFTRCGKKLQRRRQENEWRLAASRIQAEMDPAENSEHLKKKLDDNRRVASKKESEVLNKYADRQNQLNLEAVEIGDIEADESPVESDDEDAPEESASLENKDMRKQRLKRLLQDKNKKGTDGKKSTKVETENHKEEESKADNIIADSDNSRIENKEKGPSENNEHEKEASVSNDKEDPLAGKNEGDNRKSDNENIHSLSDDSKNVDSEIDELHLLQKLHSDVIDSSTQESSGSESPIAISDAISSSDNKKRESDVISIENSSYSESEENNKQRFELVSSSKKKTVTETVDVQMEIECSDAGIEKKINKSNNDEYNESVEDILLASSDDEKNEKDNSSNNSITIDQFEDKNTEELSMNNPDIIDASSTESVEITVQNSTTKENNAASAEVTSISSMEAGNDEVINTAETSSYHLEKTVDVDIAKTPLNEDLAEVNEESRFHAVKEVETLKSVETNTNENVSSSIQDEAMMSLVEENETSTDLVNNTQDSETVPIANAEEDKVNKGQVTTNVNDGILISDTKTLVSNGQENDNVRSEVTEITSSDSGDYKSQEAMEVDGDIDNT